MAQAAAFTVQETHGILWRPTNEIWAASDRRGWSSVYASVQREAPYQDHFRAVDDHLIILHLDGPVTVERLLGRRQARKVIPSGGMFMMPGGMDFGVRLGGFLNTLHVYLRRAVLLEVAADMLAGDPTKIEFLPRFGDSDPLLERLLMSLRDALDDDDPSTAAYVDYLARATAARLIRAHSSQAPEEPVKESRARLGRRQLEQAIDFMQANLERSIDLAQIAEAARLSPSHFARQFRATLGMAPHQYLVHLRIERAASLLADTDSSIAEIAFACGFSHQEHLTRLFKRSCGTTPAAYRRERQG